MVGVPQRSASVQDLIATGRWKIQKELVPLSKDRKEVIKSVGELLEAGKVQKLIIQVGEPIRVERLVPRDLNDDVPVELAEDDYASAARNGVVEELQIPDSVMALEALFYAFDRLTMLKAKGVAILLNRPKCLEDWFGWGHGTKLQGASIANNVFGVPVRYSPQIPEDSAVLAGSSESDDPFMLVTHSIRIPINLQKEEKP